MDWMVSFYRDFRAYVRVYEKVRHIESFSFQTIFWACFLASCLYCNVEFKSKEIQPDWSLRLVQT